jgi:trehalose synthase
MLLRDINEYSEIVGKGIIEELYLLADKIRGKAIQNINSTSMGGGVAEILTRMIPLLKQLGVDARWDVIKGNEKFFTITKKIHNALHGIDNSLSDDDKNYFIEVNNANLAEIQSFGDIVFIHDPQPIALVERKKEIGKKWIWRCHVDLLKAKDEIMDFLKTYIECFDSAVFSSPSFSKENLKVRQILIAPSIDPLSEKNMELPEKAIIEALSGYKIDLEKPLITQISRFDYLKDPIGVIKAYRLVKKHIDCQLLLAGGGADDDPEGAKVLEEVKAFADSDRDIFIIPLPPSSDVVINAMQRASSVIVQKSIREGFGLTVTEGLWKARPVVASAVGGIPLQIKHQYSGILTHSTEGVAYYIKKLLNEPDYAKKLGANGRENVKNNFLITRHLRDYLLLFISMFHEGEIIQF